MSDRIKRPVRAVPDGAYWQVRDSANRFVCLCGFSGMARAPMRAHAEAIAAALNAADPRNLVIDTSNARTVAVDHGQGAVPVGVVPGGRLEPPPHLLDDEGDAPAPAVDMDRLTQVFLDVSHDLTLRGAVQSGIRAVLAVLGMEVQHG